VPTDQDRAERRQGEADPPKAEMCGHSLVAGADEQETGGKTDLDSSCLKYKHAAVTTTDGPGTGVPEPEVMKAYSDPESRGRLQFWHVRLEFTLQRKGA
jgi:hypothetical protein